MPERETVSIFYINKMTDYFINIEHDIEYDICLNAVNTRA